MNKIALFPGSFDPITIGHTNIIERALPLFEKIIVGIGNNQQKSYLFDIKQRRKWIQDIYKNYDKVTVKDYTGMTIHYCKEIGAQYLLRGIRTTADFEFEKTMAQLNQSMNADIETIIILSKPEYSHISSTIVREIIMNDGDPSQFLPDSVSKTLSIQ